MDPYEVLGVPRDADEKSIRMAYRAAAKRAHPDTAGSDPEAQARARKAWDDVSTALLVLTDPKRRQQYDRSGRWDDIEPDNALAGALEIIGAALRAVIDRFGAKTPEMDVLSHVREIMRAARDHAEQDMARLRKQNADYERLAGRFTVAADRPNVFELAIQGAIKTNQRFLADAERALKATADAEVLLDGVSFRMDTPPIFNWLGLRTVPTPDAYHPDAYHGGQLFGGNVT